MCDTVENGHSGVPSSYERSTEVSNFSFIDPSVKKPNIYEETDESNTGLYIILCVLQIIGVVALALAVIWSDVYLGGFSWNGGGTNFNWHTVSMTLFIFMYGNAAVVYHVTRRMEKTKGMIINTVVNSLAFFFAVFGLVAVFRFHNVKLIPNVYSLHSWIGIGTVTLYACQLALGFCAFLFPGIANNDVRQIYLQVHIFFGGVLLALVAVAAVSGITEKMLFAFKPVYKKFVPVTYVANMLGVAITLFVMGMGFVLYNNPWKSGEGY